MTMKKINFLIIFSECEHNGDQMNYESDVIRSGANISSIESNYDEESCNMVCNTDDYESFIKEFEQTESFDFATIHV